MHASRVRTTAFHSDPWSGAHPHLLTPRGPRPGTPGEIPGLRRGANFPAEAGRVRQGHLQLRHQHHHLWPLHEAQPVVHTHAQAPLQDLQGTAVQRAARLGKAHMAQNKVGAEWGGSSPGKLPAESPSGEKKLEQRFQTFQTRRSLVKHHPIRADWP